MEKNLETKGYLAEELREGNAEGLWQLQTAAQNNAGWLSWLER